MAVAFCQYIISLPVTSLGEVRGQLTGADHRRDHDHPGASCACRHDPYRPRRGHGCSREKRSQYKHRRRFTAASRHCCHRRSGRMVSHCALPKSIACMPSCVGLLEDLFPPLFSCIFLPAINRTSGPILEQRREVVAWTGDTGQTYCFRVLLKRVGILSSGSKDAAVVWWLVGRCRELGRPTYFSGTISFRWCGPTKSCGPTAQSIALAAGGLRNPSNTRALRVR